MTRWRSPPITRRSGNGAQSTRVVGTTALWRPPGRLRHSALCFTALETLLLEGRSVSVKGDAVRETGGATAPGQHPRHTCRTTSRTGCAICTKGATMRCTRACPYANELEVARLEELTRSVVNWAAWHLEAEHRAAGVCVAFDEVHALDHPEVILRIPAMSAG